MEKRNTWIVINLVFMAYVMSRTGVRGRQDNEIQTMRGPRLLLNDPNILLHHIEALQQDLALLKSQFNPPKTDVKIAKRILISLDLEMNSLKRSIRSKIENQ